MTRQRVVEPELLDALDPEDPAAVRARRDLVRVNAVMQQAKILRRFLQTAFPAGLSSLAICDLGTGDGTLLLKIAGQWAGFPPRTRAYLVDRRPAVSTRTLDQYANLGWVPEVIEADVMAWVATMPAVDVVLCNLFLHHFTDDRLSELLAMASARTRLFVACEPRRSPAALVGSQLLGLLGCGPITRHDAVVSVRAGFRGTELSASWPVTPGWRLHEGGAGVFSHMFLARRLAGSTEVNQRDP